MREQIELKWGDGEFVSSVSRASASAALREMSVPEHAAGAGGRDIGEVLRRQAVVLLHLTELLSIDDYSGTGAAPAPAPDGHALRLARLLECIAGLDGPLSSGSTLLHAALLYSAGHKFLTPFRAQAPHPRLDFARNGSKTCVLDYTIWRDARRTRHAWLAALTGGTAPARPPSRGL